MASLLDIAKRITQSQADLLVKDTSFIPQDKLFWRPMGCAKTAGEILREIAQSNVEIAAAVKGASLSPDEEEIKKKAERAESFAELSALVKQSADVVCRVLDGLTDADPERTRTMPWGAVYSLSEAVLLPASHMTYHDGQINYIQTLLGDAKFHWAGE